MSPSDYRRTTYTPEGPTIDYEDRNRCVDCDEPAGYRHRDGCVHLTLAHRGLFGRPIRTVNLPDHDIEE